jgi:hypothetical protein
MSEEQQICISCGFCCDGTVFLHAHLDPGEKGHLPDRIELNIFTEKGRDYFRLPCLYFSEKCTIYDSTRPKICSTYRCQLLKDFASGKITAEEAISIVNNAAEIRNSLIEEYNTLRGVHSPVTFRQIHINLNKDIKESGMEGTGYELLQMRCTLFEALLIRHIRAEEDFEKMIIKAEPDH